MQIAASDVLFCNARAAFPFTAADFSRQNCVGNFDTENIVGIARARSSRTYVNVEIAPKLNDFTPVMDARSALLDRIRQVACGSCTVRGVQRIEEYLAGSHVTGA